MLNKDFRDEHGLSHMNPNPVGSNRGQRGNALIVALLVLLVLSTMALAFVGVTKTERQISGNNLRESQALYVAEAGLSEGLARMSSKSSPSYIGETGSTPTPGWGRYIVLSNGASTGDPERTVTASDSVDNDGDAQIDESGEVYPEVLSSQAGHGNPINYPWVKVRYKMATVGGVRKVILFGDHDSNPATKPCENFATGVPVLVFTSSGVQSNASKAVEIEAVKLPGVPVPGAIYTEGNLQTNGNAFHIDGHDYDPTTGDTVANGNTTPGVVATLGIGAVSCNGNGCDNIEGSGSVPSIAAATTDIDLQSYQQKYASMADVVCNGSGNCTPAGADWGTIDNYKIVHVTGDIHISGTGSGAGVLLVDGNLKVTGQFTWYGLVLVMGDIEFSGGGNRTHVYGGVMTQGSITTNGSVKGNADLLYSSMTISRLSEMSGYTVSSWKEK